MCTACVYRTYFRENFPLRYYLWQPQSACSDTGLTNEDSEDWSLIRKKGWEVNMPRKSLLSSHHYIFEKRG